MFHQRGHDVGHQRIIVAHLHIQLGPRHIRLEMPTQSTGIDSTHHPSDGRHKQSSQARFGYITGCAPMQGFRGNFLVAHTGRHNHRQPRELVPQPFGQLQAVHHGHLQIGHNHCGRILTNLLQTLSAICSQVDRTTHVANQPPHMRRLERIVFDNHDARGDFHRKHPSREDWDCKERPRTCQARSLTQSCPDGRPTWKNLSFFRSSRSRDASRNVIG